MKRKDSDAQAVEEDNVPRSDLWEYTVPITHL